MVDQTNLAEIRHAVCRPDDSRRSMGAWKEESKVRRYGRTRRSQADSHGVAKSQSEELSIRLQKPDVIRTTHLVNF